MSHVVQKQVIDPSVPAAIGMNALSRALKRKNGAIEELEARLAEQDALLKKQNAELAHSRKIFDRASEAAQIGVWECELSDCSLRWTDVVYDIFELPRGSRLDRATILELYPDLTRQQLEMVRSRAIQDKTGFCLDAEIRTARGRSRWIRITATVECVAGEPVRIFGMKQDITSEKTASLRLRYLADFDSLTGLANRSRFQVQMSGEPIDAIEASPVGAVMLIDLDRFKQVNDELGHLVGDDCLKEVGRRLSLLGRWSDCIARIGGDEFAVVFRPETSPEAVRRLGGAVVRMMRRPIMVAGHSIQIGASVGIAFSSEGDADVLYNHADTALYAAKAAGRGTVRVFVHAQEPEDMTPGGSRSHRDHRERRDLRPL